MPTMRETLRAIAQRVQGFGVEAGRDAAALRTLATRLEAELADTQGDASSLAWHVQRVLLRLDAPVKP